VPLDHIPELIALFSAEREEGATGISEAVVAFAGEQREAGFPGSRSAPTTTKSPSS
jgi:hypothetical protein